MINFGYILHNMEHMPEYDREEYLHDVVERGLIHRDQIGMLMDELRHRDEMRRKENDISPFVEAARKMLRQSEDTERKKSHTCPHCHGIGSRYVTKYTSICQGNYRRADGSYHMEQDGSEVTNHYEWKTCPDCHGTGEVRD